MGARSLLVIAHVVYGDGKPSERSATFSTLITSFPPYRPARSSIAFVADTGRSLLDPPLAETHGVVPEAPERVAAHG